MADPIQYDRLRHAYIELEREHLRLTDLARELYEAGQQFHDAMSGPQYDGAAITDALKRLRVAFARYEREVGDG